MTIKIKDRSTLPGKQLRRLFSLLVPVLSVLMVACSNGSSDSDTDGSISEGEGQAGEEGNDNERPGQISTDPVITIGDVQTLEVEGVLFTSLPEATVNTASASVGLGKLLFWDPVLSGDQDTACATCHLPEFGYADGRARSAGTSGVGTSVNRVPGQIGQVIRNAPTVLNTIWNGINELGVFDTAEAPMFWDARTQSLVAQALGPIHARDEMLGDNFTVEQIDALILQRLSANSEYQQLFTNAFGEGGIDMSDVAQALADYQSTLIANNSPFDRWMRGELTAMSNQQLQGLQVFAETGCAQCHSGPMFSDYQTHVLGVPEAAGLIVPDSGDGNFAFRTPTLRQLSFTAPYFHGGQDDTLNAVIDFYDNPNGSENPNVANIELDQDFRTLPNLNNNEAAAIQAFLESLSDGSFDQSRPDSVPSGLPVGGSL